MLRFFILRKKIFAVSFGLLGIILISIYLFSSRNDDKTAQSQSEKQLALLAKESNIPIVEKQDDKEEIIATADVLEQSDNSKKDIREQELKNMRGDVLSQPNLESVRISAPVSENSVSLLPEQSPSVSPVPTSKTPVSLPSFTSIPAPTPTPTPLPTPVSTPTPEPSRLDPPPADSKVVINEIAWGGTLASAFDEWIELFNPSQSDVDISGWVLKTEDESPKIVFSQGTIIKSSSYFLIERTDDNTISNITADLVSSFGSGGFKNSGECLVLEDASGNLIDDANVSGEAWFAGDNSLRASMERRDYAISGRDAGNWATSHGGSGAIDFGGNAILGTPGKPNSDI